MKVKIEVTLNIDPDAWATEYGIDKADVREDVKGWSEHVLLSMIDRNGTEAKSG